MGFTVFNLPQAHQRRLRTTNALERVNMELKRRTRVARLFPNEASLLRLISALLEEQSQEWERYKNSPKKPNSQGKSGHLVSVFPLFKPGFP